MSKTEQNMKFLFTQCNTTCTNTFHANQDGCIIYTANTSQEVSNQELMRDFLANFSKQCILNLSIIFKLNFHLFLTKTIIKVLQFPVAFFLKKTNGQIIFTKTCLNELKKCQKLFPSYTENKISRNKKVLLTKYHKCEGVPCSFEDIFGKKKFFFQGDKCIFLSATNNVSLAATNNHSCYIIPHHLSQIYLRVKRYFH